MALKCEQTFLNRLFLMSLFNKFALKYRNEWKTLDTISCGSVVCVDAWKGTQRLLL